MKFIIAGGRDFGNRTLPDGSPDLAWRARCHNYMGHTLDRMLMLKKAPEIISGTANGADQMGEEYAERRGFLIHRMPAEWDKHGKAAGVIRNQEMSQVADGLIAYWDGKSRGTKDMITKAINYGLETHVFRYGDEDA